MWSRKAWGSTGSEGPESGGDPVAVVHGFVGGRVLRRRVGGSSSQARKAGSRVASAWLVKQGPGASSEGCSRGFGVGAKRIAGLEGLP